MQGDVLACFYRQWLKPEEELDFAPHVWAVEACRLYQNHAPKEALQKLNQTFPEKRLLNGFIQLPFMTEHRDMILERLPKGEQQTPLEGFMQKSLESGQPIDEKTILALLSSAAIEAPQFVY